MFQITLQRLIRGYAFKQGIILIGNEGKGVSENLLKLVTAQINIPKIGDAESLNAAVATGIILAQVTSGD